MRFLLIIVLLVLTASCDSGGEEPTVVASEIEDPEQKASFRMGNGEVREEMLAEFVKQNVQHWINDDNSIGYFLGHGKIIAKIGNDVRLAYIRRN